MKSFVLLLDVWKSRNGSFHGVCKLTAMEVFDKAEKFVPACVIQ